MTDKVTSLDSYRPHMTGEVRCLTCQHSWIGVAPIGTSWMDCPKCGHHNATWYAKTIKEGDHWTCQCGCMTFHISQIFQIYCPYCGRHHGEFLPS